MRHMQHGPLMARLAASPTPNMDTNVALFYDEVVAVTYHEAVQLAQQTVTDKYCWMRERQYRITGNFVIVC